LSEVDPASIEKVLFPNCIQWDLSYDLSSGILCLGAIIEMQISAFWTITQVRIFESFSD